MEDTVYSRTLLRAAEVPGGKSKLREVLRVPRAARMQAPAEIRDAREEQASDRIARRTASWLEGLTA